MSEYVDREKLLKRLDASPLLDNPNDHALFKFIKLGVLDLIEKQPAADVVEVVRCKDCVRWSPDGGYGLDLDGTKRLYGECVITNLSHKENHFCSYGVAKMDGKGEGE